MKSGVSIQITFSSFSLLGGGQNSASPSLPQNSCDIYLLAVVYIASFSGHMRKAGSLSEELLYTRIASLTLSSLRLLWTLGVV